MLKEFLAIIFFVFSQMVLIAQNSTNEPKILFERGDYSGSSEASKKLLETYPNDPVYNYYAGAALFHLGYDYEQCLQYLDKADSGLSPKDLWLYKGKTLLYLFRLDESKRAFDLNSQNFSLLKTISGENSDWGQVIKNTKDATQKVIEITVLKRDTISESLLIRSFNTIDYSTGKWVTKDPEYFENLGLQMGEGFYYKFFENSEDNCFVITGKKGLARNDLDIFYTCSSGDIFEQTFQALPAFINSREDQRYPIFDESTQTLYFSSRGDKSLGGYDIFYSNYDKSRNKWSYPKNLGFPINSPFDDFLIGTTNDDGLYLATNRYQTKNKIEVLLIKQGKTTENIDDANALLAKSKFLDATKPKIIDQDLATAIKKLKKVNEPDKEEPITVEQVTQERDDEPQPFHNEDEYKKQLDHALTLQLKADSVGRLADAKRYRLADIKDDRMRIEEIKAIEKYEAEAVEIQKEADIAFAKVRKMELEEEARKENSSGESKNDGYTTQKSDESSLMNNFNVYNSSPYSAQNPFNFDYEIPNGLLYRIQMGVFSKELSYDHFGGLSPVTGEIIEGRGLKKYYIGLFSNFSEADKALQKIHQQGFIDCYIVAWFNGKKVSINRAEEIEAELAK